MKKTVYMDYNATAPLRDCSREAMLAALSVCGNPSSVHGCGRAARKIIEEARTALQQRLNADAYDVIFTSGGTESNALALNQKRWKQVLVSAVEHPAVLNARADVEILPVDKNGQLDLDVLDHRMASAGAGALVSVMAANNETGVLQPIGEIARIVHHHGGFLHCDAVQALGKIDLDLASIDCDLLSLSAHKIGGPQGVGALLRKRDFALDPVFKGGGQEYSLRAGTQNVAGIAGFAAAASHAFPATANLRDRLENGLKEFGSAVRILGQEVARTPNTSCFILPGMSSENQVMALDLQGFMVSAGSACSSGKVKMSHVLKAMGLSDEEAGSALRISLGWDTSEEEIDDFLKAYGALVRRLEEKKNSRSDAA